MAEDHKERIDRETIELLNELRVILPGVQVLLAFQLSAPFNQRFTQLTNAQEGAFFTALVCTAVAVVLLIAPTTYHRLQFRSGDKENLLRLSNVLVIVGTAFLAVGMTVAIGLVTDLLFGGTWTWVVLAVAAALFAGVWYAIPLSRRLGGKGIAAQPSGA
jgi:amino acid transporter